jgi:protein subunit release factor A
MAKAECRSRQSSLDSAVAEIQQRVDAAAKRSYNNSIASNRKNQVGSGMRGDKIRTYRFQDDTVQDHLTGQRAKCSAVLKGNIDLLWR